MQGQQQDDANAIRAKEEAARQQQMADAAALKEKYSAFFMEQNRPDIAQGIADGIVEPGAAYMDFIKPQNVAEAPANIREWEAFSAMTPEQQSQYLTMKRAAPFLDRGTEFVRPDAVTGQVVTSIPKDGNIPTGYNQPQPGVIEPMPGSEPDRERQAGRVKASTALNALEQKNAVSINAIDTALGQASGWNTGNVMGNIGAIPVLGQGALDLGKTLDTIKANIGFEELQTMRDNSPTGGALGSVTERELAFLQSTIASIEQSQSEDQLKRNLKTLRDFISSSQERRRAAYVQQYGGGSDAAPSGGTDDVDAILRDLGI
jgi:hypothetical protein